MTLVVIVAGALHVIAAGGFFRDPDEGTAAHLFQILVPAQVPVIAAFAAAQWDRDRRWTTRVLAVQLTLVAALVATVFLLGL